MAQKPATVRPRFPYYRSLHNQQVYAAMSYPPGFEDRNPGKYTGVTTAQYQALMARKQTQPIVYAGELEAAAAQSGQGSVPAGALGGALGALGASAATELGVGVPDASSGDDSFPDPVPVTDAPPAVSVQLQDDDAGAPPPPPGLAPPPPGGALGLGQA